MGGPVSRELDWKDSWDSDQHSDMWCQHCEWRDTWLCPDTASVIVFSEFKYLEMFINQWDFFCSPFFCLCARELHTQKLGIIWHINIFSQFSQLVSLSLVLYSWKPFSTILPECSFWLPTQMFLASQVVNMLFLLLKQWLQLFKRIHE